MEPKNVCPQIISVDTSHFSDNCNIENEVETRSLRLVIIGYSNMSGDAGLSIDLYFLGSYECSVIF